MPQHEAVALLPDSPTSPPHPAVEAGHLLAGPALPWQPGTSSGVTWATPPTPGTS